MRHVGYGPLLAALLVTATVTVAGTAGCATRNASATGAASGPAAATSAPATPAPAISSSAKPPAAASRMVCMPEAADDIEQAIGVPTSQPPTFTWSDSLLTCPYHYQSGTLVLLVKELPDLAAADAYLAAARTADGPAQNLPGIGQAAFSVADGSVYVRKDLTVLHVDVRGLPATFGQPPYSRARIAVTVAGVIMACWTET